MTVDFEKSVKLAGRWGLLGLGMFTAASGIACVAQAQLGTTPISSTPYVLAAITGLTFGQTTFWVNVFFVFMQWVLLRKLFHWKTLWQIPSVWVFGLFIDLGMQLFASAATKCRCRPTNTTANPYASLKRSKPVSAMKNPVPFPPSHTNS